MKIKNNFLLILLIAICSFSSMCFAKENVDYSYVDIEITDFDYKNQEFSPVSNPIIRVTNDSSASVDFLDKNKVGVLIDITNFNTNEKK